MDLVIFVLFVPKPSLSKHSQELKDPLSKKVDPRSRLTPRASRDRWEVEDEHEEGGATTATDYGGPVARRQSGDAAADDGEAEQTRRAQERKTRERAGLCGDQQEDVRRDTKIARAGTCSFLPIS